MSRGGSRQRLLLAFLLAAHAHAAPHDRVNGQRNKRLRAGVIEVEDTPMDEAAPSDAPRRGRLAARERPKPVDTANATAVAPLAAPTQNDSCRGKKQGEDCSDALVADGFCNVIKMGGGSPPLIMCSEKGPVSANIGRARASHAPTRVLPSPSALLFASRVSACARAASADSPCLDPLCCSACSRSATTSPWAPRALMSG